MMMEASRDPLTSAPHAAEISREELLARIADPTLQIVNVLPRPAYDDTRILRSLSLPLGAIDARAREVLPDRAADIAVYCGGPT
jgi:hypothetical protein